MFPPKNPFSTVTRRTRAPVVRRDRLHERGEDARAVLPRHDRDRGARPPEVDGRRRRRRPGGAVALGRRTVDRREEPAAGADRIGGASCQRGPHLGLELACHPDAVLVLREAVVVAEGGEPPLGHEVELVGGVDQPAPERGDKPVLPFLDQVDDRRRLRGRVRPHLRLGRVVAHAKGNHAERRERREAVEDTEQRVVEDVVVVDAGADHHLAVHIDARVEQRREPAEAGRAPPVTEQPRADVGVGSVDADVERAQLLRHHPLEIGFGEAREGREVPVEEREAVVVVLQGEALPHARRELVDEAERAVVVTGAHAVEHRVLELEAEGSARGLLHHDEPLDPAATDLELDARLVRQDLVLDDVAHRLAVEAEELVAGNQAGSAGGRCGRDAHHTGVRHEGIVWDPADHGRSHARFPEVEDAARNVGRAVGPGGSVPGGRVQRVLRGDRLTFEP